ncbi:MAG: hypothetical protein SNJ55_06805 [Chloroherpetonaceae bacterium]
MTFAFEIVYILHHTEDRISNSGALVFRNASPPKTIATTYRRLQ